MRCQALDPNNTRQAYTLPDHSLRLRAFEPGGEQIIWLEREEAEQLTQMLLQQGYALGGWTFARLALVSGLVGAVGGYVLGGLGAG